MADFAGDEPHVAHLLGLYYLDALERRQGDGIERHLQACAECRVAADETCEAIAALALIDDGDRDELIDNFGALNRSGPAPAQFVHFFGEVPAEPAKSTAVRPPKPIPPDAPISERSAGPLPEPPATKPIAGPVAKPAAKPIAGRVAKQPITRPVEMPAPKPAVKPAGRVGESLNGSAPSTLPSEVPQVPPDDRPPRAPTAAKPKDNRPAGRQPSAVRSPRRRQPLSRRARGLVGAGSLLALTLAVGGLAVGALVHGSGVPAESKVVTAAATAADDSTGASVSVFVAEQQNGVNVRATVNGLRAGTGYRLYAITRDGRALPVVNWTGTGNVQDVTGDVQARLVDLSFFTVNRAGDKAVVTVYLPQTPGPGPTSTN